MSGDGSNEAAAPFLEDNPPPYSACGMPPTVSGRSRAGSPGLNVIINVAAAAAAAAAKPPHQPTNDMGDTHTHVELHSSTKLQRQAFISTLFGIVFLQWSGIYGIIWLLWNISSLREYLQGLNFFNFWCIWTLTTLATCVFANLSRITRKSPLNLVLLVCTTVAIAITMATLVVRMGSVANVILAVAQIFILWSFVSLITTQQTFILILLTPQRSVIYNFGLNFLAYFYIVWRLDGDFLTPAGMMIVPLIVTTDYVLTIADLAKDEEKALRCNEVVYAALQVSLHFVGVAAKGLARLCDSTCPTFS